MRQVDKWLQTLAGSASQKAAGQPRDIRAMKRVTPRHLARVAESRPPNQQAGKGDTRLIEKLQEVFSIPMTSHRRNWRPSTTA